MINMLFHVGLFWHGRYEWGRYDVLLLPPSFPYGGMVLDSRRPVPIQSLLYNLYSTCRTYNSALRRVLFTGESVPHVCHADFACR